MRTTSVSVAALALASFASAGTLRLSIRENPNARSLRGLLARQSDSSTLDPSDLPPQCQSQCTSSVSLLNDCTSGGACGCSTTDIDGLETCFNCLGNLVPDEKDQLDESLDEYKSACVSSDSSSSDGGFSFSDTATGFATATSGDDDSSSFPEPTATGRSGSSGSGSNTSTASRSGSTSSSNSGSNSGSSGSGSGSGLDTGSGSGSGGSGGAMSVGANVVGLTLVTVLGGLLAL
ncbi:hypothetical protein K435DRAFT_972104 [Dendrothele bispora CBS 962.96]|uniref:Extracellular membrane protein CFEM domain-containing protein n=1 Tax=Dendrothele bispora (strain CBS 962.96) TaxID=1314807 RepID=A0A4S8L238_DENBC|nr:hypothetical protein K435DRAFT_972104 [Dendrothele bispora CBS 962.96]